MGLKPLEDIVKIDGPRELNSYTIHCFTRRNLLVYREMQTMLWNLVNGCKQKCRNIKSTKAERISTIWTHL